MIIKNLRLQRAWSQEHLASLTNLSTRTIQRIEKNDTASLESLNILAKVFELNIQDLQAKLKNKNIIDIDEVENNTKKEFVFFDYSTIRFIVINIFLIVINLITNYENLWFLYVLFGWGIFFSFKKYKKYLKFKESTNC